MLVRMGNNSLRQRRSWIDSAIPVDGTLSVSTAGLNSPSKLETRSSSDLNSDASARRWEHLGKIDGDHDSIRKASIEACVVPVNGTLARIGILGLLFSSVEGIVTGDEDGVLTCDKHATNKTIMEWAKVKFKAAAIEEAVSLSNWTTITICRAFSFQNILLSLSTVLLEKQVIIMSPNLAVLSATVLSLIPMILPFEWQSLFLLVPRLASSKELFSSDVDERVDKRYFFW